ncbi:hypothetical protein [Kibdelosporangium phytohabitans]|uniref:hypothetical protein n=1 Tax=Kibdelosporangium phytohabitans TaxID=860235 RepID=UPI00146FF0C0|nr:hypothetical protein [Kibdelosporangium phytohabitans]MBE1470807.1 hypothetical protein [Kibdelosporangium phytohabitans]
MADDVSDVAAFGWELPDGVGIVQGAVRLTTGEPVDDCGVICYALTPPIEALDGRGWCTNSDGGYAFPTPAGTYALAAHGLVPRVGAEGTTVLVPVIGKVEVVVFPHRVVKADIVATERPDLVGWEGRVADLLGIRDWRHREDH